MIHILYTFCESRLDDEVFAHYLYRVPKAIRQRILKYRRWEDAHCGLFGKILLIEGLKKYGLDEIMLNKIRYTSYSRPYLNAAPDFNISHSGNGVICAISDDCSLGIDIEEINPLDIRDFRRQFTDKELLLMREAKDTYHEFYLWWTRKEAIIKADGKGLNIPLKKIKFPQPGLAEVNGRSWQIREIPLREKYCCHLAFAGKADMPVKVEHYAINSQIPR